MSWRDELLTGFVNWERDVRLARDKAIAKVDDPAKQKAIRQIYNIKISVIAESATVIKEFTESNSETLPPGTGDPN